MAGPRGFPRMPPRKCSAISGSLHARKRPLEPGGLRLSSLGRRRQRNAVGRPQANWLADGLWRRRGVAALARRKLVAQHASFCCQARQSCKEAHCKQAAAQNAPANLLVMCSTPEIAALLPRRLPRGCRVLVARRVLLLRRLTGHAIAMHVGAPHRRSTMLGIVMPGRHRANGAATNHHSFCHLNLPCAVESSSSTLPGCPLLECLSVHAARGTSGSRRRLAQHFRHYIGKGGARTLPRVKTYSWGGCRGSAVLVLKLFL